MARQFLIIDGYNLMHAAGIGRKRYGPGDLERCRNRLLNQLATRLSKAAASDTIVVFDAHEAEVREVTQQFLLPFRVRFSTDGRDADSEIELLLASHSSPKQVLIISSDHRLHKSARRRRASCVDSEEFWNQLETVATEPNKTKPAKPPTSGPKSRTSATGHGKPPTGSHDAEADYAQDFMKIDIDEIKRSVRKERK